MVPEKASVLQLPGTTPGLLRHPSHLGFPVIPAALRNICNHGNLIRYDEVLEGVV